MVPPPQDLPPESVCVKTCLRSMLAELYRIMYSLYIHLHTLVHLSSLRFYFALYMSMFWISYHMPALKPAFTMKFNAQAWNQESRCPGLLNLGSWFLRPEAQFFLRQRKLWGLQPKYGLGKIGATVPGSGRVQAVPEQVWGRFLARVPMLQNAVFKA